MEIYLKEILDDIIQKSDDKEQAEMLFSKSIKEDEELRDFYEEWCSSMGYNERKGFSEYYDEFNERHDGIWDSIFPNKEEYEGY